MFLPPRHPQQQLPDRRVVFAVLVWMAALICPFTLSAATADRLQAVDVNADTIDGSLADDGESLLSGTVRITQGSLHVQADNARVTRTGGDLQRVLLEGAPARLKQIDDKGQAVNASARQIIYQPAADIIELLGNVVIEQPQGNLTGERITYDLGTGRIQADGQGGRVSMRMNPKPAKTDSGAE